MMNYSNRIVSRAGLLLLFLVSASCSSITTAYYARPDERSLAAERCPASGYGADTIPCARLKVDGIEIVYWANTDYHPTMTGPCLFPVFPAEAPIFASYSVRLNWRILLPPSLKDKPVNVSVLQSSLFASVDDSRTDKPTNLTRYRFEDGRDQIDEHWSFAAEYEPIPDTIGLKGDTTLEIWYNSIFYMEVKSFSVQPAFRINGKTVQGPRIVFTPEEDRKYTPFIFPYMLPPVR